MDLFDLRNWTGFSFAGGSLDQPAWIDSVSIDSRRIHSAQGLFVALAGAHLDGHQFIADAAMQGAKYAVVEQSYSAPSIPSSIILLKVSNPLHALQEIASAYRKQMKARFISIAGSHGKTMVKDLLQMMLSRKIHVAASPESFNSQIGAALSIFTVKSDHKVALIETAISEKHEMSRLSAMVQPDHVLITHLGKKYLSSLASQDVFAEELMQLACAVMPKNWLLLPQSPWLDPLIDQLQGSVYHWNRLEPGLPHAHVLSTDHAARMRYKVTFPHGECYEGETSQGFYYFMDLINMTIKAAWLLGAGVVEIQQTLREYIAEPIRNEVWQTVEGWTVVNECYCSDPISVYRALNHLKQMDPQARCLFLFNGLKTKNPTEVDYGHMGHGIAKAAVDTVILVGDHPYDSLISVVAQESPATKLLKATDVEKGLQLVRDVIRPQDLVLIKGEKKLPFDEVVQTLTDHPCNTKCFINFAAIASNIAAIRKKIDAKVRMMVAVKALAYGTHHLRMSRFLENCGVDILGVSHPSEGIVLKQAGVKQAVFVLDAAPNEAEKIAKWELEVGVSNKEIIAALAGAAERKKIKLKVHLHVDTGMNRFGCHPEEALDVALFVKSFPSLTLEGIFSHLSSADDPAQDAFTHRQLQLFEEVIVHLEAEGISIPWHHIANSSGAIRFDLSKFNMARIGLAIYGLYPSAAVKQALELRLAVSLVTKIVGIKICKKGESISYGRKYVVSRPYERIATLPLGYFDGLHRHYSGKGHVLIRGQRAPMIGTICMDYVMVDVTEIPEAVVGDPVLVFGEDEHGDYLSPEDLASSGDSIVHELITCLGPRIPRVFIHEEAGIGRREEI